MSLQGIPLDLLIHILYYIDVETLIVSVERCSKEMKSLVSKIINKKAIEKNYGNVIARRRNTVATAAAMTSNLDSSGKGLVAALSLNFHSLIQNVNETNDVGDILSSLHTERLKELRQYRDMYDSYCISCGRKPNHSDLMIQYHRNPSRFDKLITTSDGELKGLLVKWEERIGIRGNKSNRSSNLQGSVSISASASSSANISSSSSSYSSVSNFVNIASTTIFNNDCGYVNTRMRASSSISDVNGNESICSDEIRRDRVESVCSSISSSCSEQRARVSSLSSSISSNYNNNSNNQSYGGKRTRRGSIVAASLPRSEEEENNEYDEELDCFSLEMFHEDDRVSSMFDDLTSIGESLPQPPPLPLPIASTSSVLGNQARHSQTSIQSIPQLPEPRTIRQTTKSTSSSILSATIPSYSFYQFIKMNDLLKEEMRTRKRNLETIFDTEKNELTLLGRNICKCIFEFFDIDGDGALKWNELSELNLAAELPLTVEAYEWVQRTFETNEKGYLTLNGYQQMFLDNCIRVPELMFKDLQRLDRYIIEQKQSQVLEQLLETIHIQGRGVALSVGEF